MGPTAVHLQDGNLHNTKEATTGYPGEGARKNFERNKFLFKNGEKNICSQAPCIYSVTDNVKKKKKTKFSRHFDVK